MHYSPYKSLLALFFFLLSANTKAIEQSFRGWNRFSLLTPKATIRLSFEFQPERQWVREQNQLEQFDIKVASIFQLTESSNARLGLAWTPTIVPQFVSEFRIWEAFQLEHLSKNHETLFEYRLRSEQRWIATATEIAHRISGRLLLKKSLHNKVHESSSWGIAAYSEYFLNINTVSDTVPAGFGQIESFIGPMWQATANLYLQIGYLNDVSRGITNTQMFHILYSNLELTL